MHKMRKTLNSALILALALIAIGTSFHTQSADAGEGFFEKIGDGWKKGKWVPGLPDVKPQTLQEVIFPVCWGRPQECRDEADKKVGPSHPPLYSTTFRVDCVDAQNGRDRGDTTITYTSSKSLDDAQQTALQNYNSSDLCQVDPNYKDASRVMKPGSGRFLN